MDNANSKTTVEKMPNPTTNKATDCSDSPKYDK